MRIETAGSRQLNKLTVPAEMGSKCALYPQARLGILVCLDPVCTIACLKTALVFCKYAVSVLAYEIILSKAELIPKDGNICSCFGLVIQY